MKSKISRSDYDVIIIGGGPAGSIAAFYLAHAGLKTALFEKDNFPRYKTCGGGLTYKAFRMIPFDVEDAVEVNCFSARIVDFQLNEIFSVTRDFPIISMTMRENFDAILLKKARSVGSGIFMNCRISDVNIYDDSIKVSYGDSYSTAKFLIAADGANGIVSRLMNRNLSLKKIPALEYEIVVDEVSFDSLREIARFDFGIIPNGYGWIFPKKNHLSVGVLSMKKGINLNKAIEVYLQKIGINKIIKVEKHGFFIPLRKSSSNFTHNRVLFAGDAAGFADPLTAEGISNAVLSGKIAAEAIIKEVPQPSKVRANYNFQIKKQILNELKYSGILAFFVYKNNLVRRLLFKLYGQKLSEIMTNIITGEVNYSDLLLNPFNYLKLFKYLFFKKSIIDKKELIRTEEV